MPDEPTLIDLYRQGNGDEELEALDRTLLALSMRKNGRASYQAIGKALGVSRGRAWQIVKRAMSLLKEQGAEEIRKTEMERMDGMLAILMPKVLNGEGGAMKLALDISKHRAELAGAYKSKPLESFQIPVDKLSTSQLERLKRGDSIYDVLLEATSQLAGGDRAGTAKEEAVG